MKYICLIILFILICCTINSITATEVNNTINHTMFVNDISDIINEIDYNNPIKQNGEYIQQHINYINTLNDDFKLFLSLNVKNNNSSFINPIYNGLNNTSNNNYTKNIITNNLINKTDLKLNNNLSVVDITDKTNISLVNDFTISYNDSLDTSINISKNSKLDNKTPDNFNITSADNSTTNVYPDTSILVNNSVDKNKHSKVLFNNTSSHQNNVIDNQFNKSNKDINKSLINKSDSKLNNDSSIINSTNIHFNTSNLINIVVDKNNKSNVLFNESSDNQNQFNKSFKVFEVDKDNSIKYKSIGLTNDSISKKLNSSEINNISNNNSSRDDHINHVSEPKQDKDYIMLLIPILLVLLGAIILYKKTK